MTDEKERVALLPCPFACLPLREYNEHEKPKILKDGNSYHVECGWCGAHAGENYFTEEAAIERWNTRAQKQPVSRDVVEALQFASDWIEGLFPVLVEKNKRVLVGDSSESRHSALKIIQRELGKAKAAMTAMPQSVEMGEEEIANIISDAMAVKFGNAYWGHKSETWDACESTARALSKQARIVKREDV